MVEWHSLSKAELLKRFNSKESGLSETQAREHFEKYGPNQIEFGKKISLLSLLAEQFTSPLVLILIFSAFISFYFGKEIDSFLIFAIVIANGIFGFVQNFNAEKSIEALKKLGSPKALVLRAGEFREIESKEIVPGDILILQEGMKISADARVIRKEGLTVDESLLTGESVPVSKITESLPADTALADRRNMIFMNTLVVKGKGMAIVVGTGPGTEVGKIADQLESIHEEPTRFHVEIDDLSKKISLGILVLLFVIAGTMFYIHNADIIDVFITAISVAVAAIPEGLPAVVTLSLALATQKMLKKKSLVRKLPVIETLGSVDVICTDKTGTLTENSMTVQEIFYNNKNYTITGTGRSITGNFFLNGKKINSGELEKILLCGLACNDTITKVTNKEHIFIGDPTEIALTVSALKAGLVLEGMQRISDVPFSSERKKMTIAVDYGAVKIAYSKGAPEVILDSCTHVFIEGKKKALTEKMRQDILAKNDEFASKALRVLGFAYKEIENTKDIESNLVFLGLQGMIDPPRKEIKSALETARQAGIKVLMLTGDNMLTAKAIGKQIGFEGKIIDSRDLAKLSEQEFNKAVLEYDIFARVSPEQKLGIMRALKAKGYSVAMTGDGVNDAPALKQADVGIAMGIRGSDVAKEASDIILLDDNFATIIEAIKYGRSVFDNIRKFVNYLMSNNLAEVAIIFIASLPGYLPITPVQILWINLLTDGMPALALGADPPKPRIMNEPPRSSKEQIITKELGVLMLIIAAILTVIILAIFFMYLPRGIVIAQTMVFTSLIVFEFVRVVVIREQDELSMFSNKWLIYALVLSMVLQLLVLYTPLSLLFQTIPLGLEDWFVILVGAAIAYVASVIASKGLARFWIKQKA